MNLICSSCGREFNGRPNHQYCSIKCRRAIELRRRHWDQAQRYVRFYELEAQRSESESRAAAHRAQAARIRERAGPTRP